MTLAAFRIAYTADGWTERPIGSASIASELFVQPIVSGPNADTVEDEVARVVTSVIAGGVADLDGPPLTALSRCLSSLSAELAGDSGAAPPPLAAALVTDEDLCLAWQGAAMLFVVGHHGVEVLGVSAGNRERRSTGGAARLAHRWRTDVVGVIIGGPTLRASAPAEALGALLAADPATDVRTALGALLRARAEKAEVRALVVELGREPAAVSRDGDLAGRQPGGSGNRQTATVSTPVAVSIPNRGPGPAGCPTDDSAREMAATPPDGPGRTRPARVGAAVTDAREPASAVPRSRDVVSNTRRSLPHPDPRSLVAIVAVVLAIGTAIAWSLLRLSEDIGLATRAAATASVPDRAEPNVLISRLDESAPIAAGYGRVSNLVLGGDSLYGVVETTAQVVRYQLGSDGRSATSRAGEIVYSTRVSGNAPRLVAWLPGGSGRPESLALVVDAAGRLFRIGDRPGGQVGDSVPPVELAGPGSLRDARAVAGYAGCLFVLDGSGQLAWHQPTPDGFSRIGYPYLDPDATGAPTDGVALAVGEDAYIGRPGGVVVRLSRGAVAPFGDAASWREARGATQVAVAGGRLFVLDPVSRQIVARGRDGEVARRFDFAGRDVAAFAVDPARGLLYYAADSDVYAHVFESDESQRTDSR